MTFEALLALLLVYLAAKVARDKIRSQKDQPALVPEADTKQETVEELRIKRLKELEESLAVQFAGLVDGTKAVASIESVDTTGGRLVTISAKEGNRKIARVLIDLTYSHGEWPLILELGENGPVGYSNTDQDTISNVASEAWEYTQTYLCGGRVH